MQQKTGMDTLKNMIKKKYLLLLVCILLVVCACAKQKDGRISNNEIDVTINSADEITSIISESNLDEFSDRDITNSKIEEQTEKDNYVLSHSGKDTKLPNWEEYQGILGDKKYKEFQRYIPLLEGKKSFFESDTKESKTLFDYLSQYEEEEYLVLEYTLIDMDRDGNDELLLATYIGPGFTMVIKEIDDEFYTSLFGAREMSNIQKNGKYIGSGGKGRVHFCQLEISKEDMKSIQFAERYGVDDPNRWSDEFTYYFMKENYSNPADWYELNLLITK